jgi:hypothetical protein
MVDEQPASGRTSVQHGLKPNTRVLAGPILQMQSGSSAAEDDRARK